MNEDIAVKVEHVSKSFKLPHEKSGSIKGILLGWRKKRRGYENQHVLRDISFEIKKGEFFGIVGRNGSGKSTLLKLISQIYSPDSGSITVNGKLTPFIELGVGFNPELSGRDNVYLNGALLGFGREEMNDMYDEIVEFAELERFMDQKLKNYSSGMQVRLAFSIAIRANTDILVLDEVLAVGDEAFQQKCYDYFAKVKKEGKTIILVTHDMGSVQRFCKRALLLEGGKIVKIGSSPSISTMYSNLFLEERNQALKNENRKRLDQSPINTESDARLTNVRLLQDRKEREVIKAKENFTIELRFNLQSTIDKAVVGINLVDGNGNIMLATSTREHSPTVKLFRGENRISFSIDNIYTDSTYSINAAVTDESRAGMLLYQAQDIHRFEIKGIKYAKHSLTHPRVQVELGHES